MGAQGTIRTAIACSAAFAVAAACVYAQAASPVLVDRVIAVVNNSAILASDVDREMRLSVLEPNSGKETPDAKSALDRLISRTLIQQQIRREEAQAAAPKEKDVEARIAELRAQLPACIRLNCATAEGWARFLTTQGLTGKEVDDYIQQRLEFLAFIENRFQQGIRIAPEEVEDYYKKTLVPEYAKGQTPPPLQNVSQRIEEILLQEHVNSMFDAWLVNLRKQGDVEILDPALETPGESSQGGGGA
jgi:hypothetical protein